MVHPAAGVDPRETRQKKTNELLARAATEADPDERRRLLDEVVLLNLPVAKSVASRYRDRGVPTDDLEQIACMGLVRAAQRFDPEMSSDFLTYAVPSMNGELRRYFRDHGWSVRPPRRLQELRAAVLQAVNSPGHEAMAALVTGGERGDEADRAQLEELATELGVTVDDIQDAIGLAAYMRSTSLEATLEAGDSSLPRLLAVDDDQERAEARVLVESLTASLSERERLVLHLRYHDGLSQREIGERIGVGQVQVSRILDRTLKRLRQLAGLAAPGFEPAA